MSKDESMSRKEKKAARDADRHKKGKKRKREDAEDGNAEEQNEFDKDFIPLGVGDNMEEMKGSKSKVSKSKSTKRKADNIEKPIESSAASKTADAPKPKKRKKTKTSSEQTDANGEKDITANKNQNHKFILFIGNLPYTATDASITAHFKSLQPFVLRHRTDPKTGKSKGFAFLEFEGYDRMKTCLKLYHHSMFDPDKTSMDDDKDAEAGDGVGAGEKKPSKKARRINVELTAGGGGKAEGRKEKIRVKNQRLGEQRQRRAEVERKEREKKAAEEDVHGVKVGKKGERAKKVEQKGGEVMEGVHPSRLARIAG